MTISQYGMKKKKKKKKQFIRGLILLIMALLVSGIAYYIITDHYEPLELAEDIATNDAFLEDGEPLIQSITRWHYQEHQDFETINQRLPDSVTLLILDEDINDTSNPNFVLISDNSELPELNSSLVDAGFTHTFQALTVYELRDEMLSSILTIHREDIRDEFGAKLIQQIPAENGYALVMEPYNHDALYDRAVKLIEIVMMDQHGMPVSDDIVIYWDPSESAYKATNTFGHP